MGGGASVKKDGRSEGTKTKAYIEIASSGSNFKVERDQHRKIERVIYTHKPLDFRKNTFFSKKPISFRSRTDKVGIGIDGAAVIRIGLVQKCPGNDNDFVKDTLFLKEDAFGAEKGERRLFVNAIGYVCYGLPGQEVEYKKIATESDLWIYITVIYGNPTFKATHDKHQITWAVLHDANIGLKRSDAEASCGRVRNAELCMLSEPINTDETYYIDWDMRLEGEAVCEKVPEYGFFSMGIVATKPADLSTFAHGSEDEVWFTRSAVQKYPYNGKIAFKIDKREETITHNLLVTSVEQTRTDFLKIDRTHPQSYYLVLEVSSGELSVSHNRSYVVKQSRGSIFFVKNYRIFDEMLGLELDIQTKADSHKPCRIQFGSDPKSFIVEFAERLTHVEEESMKSRLETSVVSVTETSMIQIMDVPEGFDAHKVGEIFSREQMGGGEIREMRRDEDILGTWLITYVKIEDARNIWMKGDCQVDGHTCKVLPYFRELQCAVNYGKTPLIDKEPLLMKQLNTFKMDYITKKQMEKKKFEVYMKKKANVRVLWMVHSDNQFESSDDEEDNQITFECQIPSSEYKKLALWKTHTTKCVNEYFTNVIMEQTVKVGDAQLWNEVCNLLTDLKHDFDFHADKGTLKVKLISTNNDALDEIALKINNVKLSENQATKTLSLVDIIPKYQALNNEGILRKVESDNPNTSFMVDFNRKEVTIKGPESEVERAEIAILKLAADMTQVIVNISVEEATILQTDMGKSLFQNELEQQQLGTNFKIKDDSCRLWVSEAGNKQKVENVLKDFLKTATVQIPNAAIEVLDNEKWTSFKHKKELESNGLIVIVVNCTEKLITVTGTQTAIDNIKSDLVEFLKSSSTGDEVVHLPTDITHFLIIYGDEGRLRNCEFKQDISGDYTGEVIIKENFKERQKLKSYLRLEAGLVKTFWFYLEKQWLASVIMDLTIIDTLANIQKCILQADIADSFAHRGVPVVAILPKHGTIIEVINGDIISQNVDVIVNAANADLKHNAGLGSAIVKAGGTEIQTECTQYVTKNGQVAVGDVFVSCPGQLRCRSIYHAVGPKWNGGGNEEEATLKKLIQKLLQIADSNKHATVVMPALCCGALAYPVDKATRHIVEAVAEYLVKNSNSSIKEVLLCDTNATVVDNFTNAVTQVLKDPTWFTFKHNRSLSPSPVLSQLGADVTDGESSKGPLSMDRSHSLKFGQPDFKKTLKWGGSGAPAALSKTMRWGLQGGTAKTETNKTDERSSDEDVSSGNEDGNSPVRRKATFAGGLPYKVEITDKTCLHVIKGSIESQQTDVIVNTTPVFPNLVGAVSNALDKASGGAVTTDCKQLGTLASGEVKRTSGRHGSLKCNHIYHVLTKMDWNPERGYDHVYDIVKVCLAEANSNQCTSIAFPAIGTGASHFPADKVADAMVKAACDFATANQNTSVQDVFIVVYFGDSGTCQIFEQQIPTILTVDSTNNDADDVVPKNKPKREKKKPLPKPQKKRNINIDLVKKPIAKYTAPATVGDHSVADDVVFIKVTSKTDSDTIRKEFEKLVNEEFITKPLNFKELSDENKLSTKEETTLKNLEKQFAIKVEIDEPNTLVKLIGLRKMVKDAEVEARRLLSEDFPRWRLKQQMVKRISDTVQWCYDDNGTVKPVQQESNFDIHIEYLKGKDFVYLNQTENVKYKVIINDLEEHPVSDPTKRRRLFQRANVSQDVHIPQDWSIANGNKDAAEVQLQPQDPEFNDVKNEFLKGGCPATQVLNIIRIEDKYKWLQLEAKKKQLEKQNPKNVVNERRLWHGTDVDTVPRIIRGGYDRSFCGVHATAYGKGAYFATTSSYSHGYAKQDPQGTCRMFLSRVLTGEYTVGNGAMGYLPVKDPNNMVLFDSAVDNVKNPAIFVIFHDTQAYPVYLIEYK